MLPRAVPVVMFHSVADDRPERPASFVRYAGVDEFASFLRYLRWRSYRTLTLSDLFAFLSGKSGVPDRSIVLTFDDGYLDNWVAVAPLLPEEATHPLEQLGVVAHLVEVVLHAADEEALALGEDQAERVDHVARLEIAVEPRPRHVLVQREPRRAPW